MRFIFFPPVCVGSEKGTLLGSCSFSELPEPLRRLPSGVGFFGSSLAALGAAVLAQAKSFGPAHAAAPGALEAAMSGGSWP